MRKTDIESYITLYADLVYTVCLSFTRNPFDAEDMAQETFLAALAHKDRFDGANPRAWLTRIAANKCRDLLKSAARTRTDYPDEALDEFEDPGGSAELEAERELSEQDARALCNRLDEPYRTAALLYYCDGLSFAEIAEKTGAPPKTAATRLYRAREKLKILAKEMSLCV